MISGGSERRVRVKIASKPPISVRSVLVAIPWYPPDSNEIVKIADPFGSILPNLTFEEKSRIVQWPGFLQTYF